MDATPQMIHTSAPTTADSSTTFQLEVPETAHSSPDAHVKAQARNLTIHYGPKLGLDDVSLDLNDREVTALVGPSGCGKSTFLRALNRTNEIIPECVTEGSIEIDGEEIYRPNMDLEYLRRRIGMVAQKPNPFPASVFDNVAYGPRIHGMARDRTDLEEIVENAMRRAGLWDEMKDRMKESGTDLSGGQQQRLCIARAIAIEPHIILMDEPCSALDPIATAHVEDLIDELREKYAVVIVTHNLQQAARVAQRTAHFHLGKLIEAGDTEQIFINPIDPKTEAFVTGRFG